MKRSWKTVRVFISSTFRDMHAERDHLVKVVFPELRERLEKYRVYLIDIDLRWGVTKEQAENDQVLDLCLQQIDECRPFFVSILGERYGWVPRKFPVEAFKKYGWIQHVTGKSVTELEILHGVLNNPEMQGHAFFYFRDPEALKDVPDDIKKEVYIETATDLSAKLTSLKERIRTSGYPVTESYPAKWDSTAYDRPAKRYGRLTGLEKFGDIVLEQLWEAIKAELQLPDKPPAETEIDPLSIEQDFHERFIELHTRFYVGRDEIHNDLLTYINGDDNRPCIVTGPSGTGKSSILSRLCREDIRSKFGALLIPFFIGASPASTSLHSTLKYLCTVLKNSFDFKLDIPTETQKLITTFRSFLFSVPENRRLIIAMDGINQFDETDHPEELAWLPEELAPNVRIILSCIDDPGHSQRALERAREMKVIEKKVESLSDEERMEIIRKVPSISAKTLDDNQINMLVTNTATRNPLYLLIALEELRGFGSFEELNNRISEFPAIDDPKVKDGDIIQAIFLQVIERLEQEFNAELVKTLLALLACARRGLSEKELQNLLSSLSGKEDLFPVLRQLRQYLVKRGELIDFFHRGLWKAVNEMYLKEEEIKKGYHLQLADYFEKRELDDRKVDELPWQMSRAQAFTNLYNLLANLSFFEIIWRLRPHEVSLYWVEIETNTSLRISDAYSIVLTSPLLYQGFDSMNILQLLQETGHSQDAADFLKDIISGVQFIIDPYLIRQQLPNDGDAKNIASLLGNFALTLKNKGEADKAIEVHKKEEHICRMMKIQDGLQRSLGNQARIYIERSDVEKALVLLQEKEIICRSINNRDALQTALFLQAQIMKIKRNLSKAKMLYKECDRLCREMGNKKALASVIGEQGTILEAEGNLEQAMMKHKEVEQIAGALGSKYDLQASYCNQANILLRLGEYKMALSLYRDQERVCREINDYNSLYISLFNQAEILKLECKTGAALVLYREMEEICRKLGIDTSDIEENIKECKRATPVLQSNFANKEEVYVESVKINESSTEIRIKETHCCNCGITMKILLPHQSPGQTGPSLYSLPKNLALSILLKESLQCTTCGCQYCGTCSKLVSVCNCGKQSAIRSYYFEDNVDLSSLVDRRVESNTLNAFQSSDENPRSKKPWWKFWEK